MDEAVAVILAAGKGTRMKVDDPKVLVKVLGRAMVHYVLDAVFASGIARAIVIVGYRAEDVRKELSQRGDVARISFAEQLEQKGTGHAVMMAAEQLAGHSGPVVVVTGDSPLVQVSSLKKLLEIFHRDRPGCILGTLHKKNPTGLGRIVRSAAGEFVGIVEERDATDEQRELTEVNMSTYVFDGPALLAALPKLGNNNRQGEFYITDSPAILKAAGRAIRAEPVLQPCEALSINNWDELRVVEDGMRKLGYV
jgi:bifunctional UDP-N-acetylglucosamine pyrophosphorylase/glucosamine-1-phosphate N-acetyltransferase/UDP-N-acetylglucosamine pyrophosphorylase